MAEGGVRPRRLRRRAGHHLRGHRTHRAGRRAHADHGGGRALLRRERRHAAGHPRALRRARQHGLGTETVKEVLEQAVLASPIFTARWRWDAGRSLALLRFMGGKKVPPQIQRMRSDDLLASVFPDVAACQENITGDMNIPDHPLVREVMKDVLTEALDLEGLRAVLRGIAAGGIRTVAVDTPVPSAFSHEILNANPYAFLDDAPLEERRARAVELRRALPASVLEA